MSFEEVTEEWHRSHGGERHLRRVSERMWVSVLYRLTGFGWMQWETAIVRIRDDDDPLKYQRGSWDDREIFMVGGDWRHELEHLDESELLEWFKLKSQDAND